jgi:tetratricopeptide (TPR) repeat protein
MTTQSFAGESVFVCYAIRDQEPDHWLNRLKVQLEPLMRHFHFELWDDSQIEPGQQWRIKIEESLWRARAAVLLVGPGFLASYFINSIELPVLLLRAEREGIPLLILVTHHCNYHTSVLADFQAFREENRALEPLEALATPDQNRILQAFSLAIKRSVEQRRQNISEQKVRHNVPMKPSNVVGRDRELKNLSAALLSEDKPVVLASGFGGVGKSTIAKLIAWDFLDRQRPFKFIPWVDVRQYSENASAEPITFRFVLNSIARAASPENEIISIGDMEVKAGRVRELLSSTDSLLILDNYESLLEKKEEEQEVARFIDSLPIGTTVDEHYPLIRVLITTRVVSPALSALHSYNKRLEKLPFEDSLRMMTSRPDAPKLKRSQWKRVWEKLQGLPKYMQVAVPQLNAETFAHWEENVTKITWRPNEPDDFFYDLFEFSWRNPTIISNDLKQILLAMTYFVGHAPPEELYRTVGLERDRFVHALSSAYSARYVDVDRKKGSTECYTLHSLMHSYCRAALNSDEFRVFRRESSARFVYCYSDFANSANINNEPRLLDEESENVLAAVRVARRLKAWEALINFRQNTGDFYRHRGKWDEYREVVDLACTACRYLGNKSLLAKCLVYDLAWYYSRLEDVATSRKFIEEGYSLFRKLGDDQGMAQAERHLGKTALLSGLDDLYHPLRKAECDFRRAEDHYRNSLDMRKRLCQRGYDQSLAIADMKLDFGRLYWLQGMWFQERGKYDEAKEKYIEADCISEEARLQYEQMSLGEGIAKARVAKAWGNRGNARKELASCFGETQQWRGALENAEAAEQYYRHNLSLGEEISKKDEIAHALAGLGEIRFLMSKWPSSVVQTDKKLTLLREAWKETKRSHRLYEEMAGPSAQMGVEAGGTLNKTRDEMRTKYLINEIENLKGKLGDELHPRLE